VELKDRIRHSQMENVIPHQAGAERQEIIFQQVVGKISVPNLSTSC
jgi:hypothetical protein